MTVLFGSFATSSSRAPAHAPENNEESLNRLFEDEATDVKDQLGGKLVSVRHYMQNNRVFSLSPVGLK